MRQIQLSQWETQNGRAIYFSQWGSPLVDEGVDEVGDLFRNPASEEAQRAAYAALEARA